jgi:hypothetical protein
MNPFKSIWLTLCLSFLGVLIFSFAGVLPCHADGLKGHYPDQGGIGATVADCNICHDFDGGCYDNCDPGYNLRWVKRQIVWNSVTYDVEFRRFEDGGKTLADGDITDLDGPCEVCHTQTHYHCNQPDCPGDFPNGGHDHFSGENCIECHPHFTGDIVNYFVPAGASCESSHGFHLASCEENRGWTVGITSCTSDGDGCHNVDAFNGGDYKMFGDTPQTLANTDVCNDCHSPGPVGGFDGVGDMDPGNQNSVDYGAKYNWAEGVYVDTYDALKSDKKKWCFGCHDLGSSVVNTVAAPGVMGDNTTYGYNVSGHGLYGVECERCHDLTLPHTDGVARTYSASSNNYNEGYRLHEGMAIPRDGEIGSVAFDLCTSCHNYGALIGTYPITTGFREGEVKNHHNRHLETAGWENDLYWDSDYDGSATDSYTRPCDSAMSCPACHNIHGSPMDAGGTLFPNPVMIRHGELIGHVPAFDFQWRKDGWDGTPTALYGESACGGMKCGSRDDPFKTAAQKLAVNHVCIGCHYGWDDPPYEDWWYCRTTETVDIESVWVSNTTYQPNTPITYNVRFKITGAGSYHTKLYKSRAFNTSGTDWETNLQKHKTLSAGTYQWSVPKTIPAEADAGSGAKVVIQIRIYTGVGGTLLDNDKDFTTFSIQAP